MRILNLRNKARGDAVAPTPAATGAGKDTEVPLVLAKDIADPVMLHHTTPPKGTTFDRLTRAQLIADLESAHSASLPDKQ